MKRPNPDSVPAGQGELFAAHRNHALFTDSPEPMLAAESTHQAHAVVERVIADLEAGSLAQLPSGSFAAHSAWLVLATIAFNLTCAAGALASRFHARATTATIRAQLMAVPVRLVLQRQLWRCLSASAVVGGAGLGLASSAPPGPVDGGLLLKAMSPR